MVSLDFHTKLGSLSPNTIYLSRYIRYVRYRLKNPPTSQTVEKHHILPVSFFPMFKTHPENIVVLTPKEHFVVHYLLMKAFPSITKFTSCVAMMGCGRKDLLSKWMYEAARKANAIRMNGMSTFFDTLTGKYVKAKKTDTRMGITLHKCMWRSLNGKTKWLCDKDPVWEQSVEHKPKQSYIDQETGLKIQLLPEMAKQHPERFVHVRAGTTFKKAKQGETTRWDKIEEKFARVNKDIAAVEINRYESVVSVRSMSSPDSVFLLPKSEFEKRKGVDVVPVNAGRCDVILQDGSCRKIWKSEFDPAKHVKRGSRSVS